MTNLFRLAELHSIIDERYTVDQIFTGNDRGQFATKFHGIKIKLSDTHMEAIEYTHAYEALRMSSFKVECDTLLTMAEKVG